MKVNILASGSSGNCIALTYGEITILIDAGIAKTKIEKKLLEVGITPNNVKAIFITHAHADHCKGLPLAEKYSIPVYASEGEWKSIKNVEGGIIIPKNGNMYEPLIFDMGELAVLPFAVHHDSYEPLGFTISGETTVSVCFDTGIVDDDMLQVMKDSDVYIIESNHEPRMVEASSYPNSVKARILSHIGHLSNEQTAAALCKLVKGNGERIYLTHLSSSNNLPALAEITVIKALKDKGLKQDQHYKIEVV